MRKADIKSEEPATEAVDKFVSVLKEAADTGIAILNGVIGDYLHERANDLATRMRFFHEGKELALDPEVIDKVCPIRTGKIAVYVHGSAEDEHAWGFPGDPATSYGSLLEKEFGFTPFYLRYNSGLHVSENGRSLDFMMDELFGVHRLGVKEITFIGHSMGGLVIRSACHLGECRNAQWVKCVRRIICIGSPHQGAPLEKIGNVLTGVLKMVPTPYTKLAAEIINLRSAGIKDMRFGYTCDDDWKGYDPDAVLTNTKNTIPLLKGVPHYVIAGALTSNPNDLISDWFGDAMVRKGSATGKAGAPEHCIPFPPENQKILPSVNHIALAHHPAVYKQIKAWCRTAPKAARKPAVPKIKKVGKTINLAGKGRKKS
ncbi:MAG: alpha/beta hydrolase [Myxococcota bacterium]|jgi:triacylglycerol esterase/lipase EstA (alpha/beta hydrolase family)